MRSFAVKAATLSSPARQRRRHLARASAAVLVALAATAALQEPASATLPGTDPQLTRAPYLTDLGTARVQVNWATSTQSRGIVKYGPIGNCTANTVQSATLGSPTTINGVREYTNSVAVTGLAADTQYCYRVYTGGTPQTDLLGTNPSPAFTTLQAAGGAAPVTFAAFGDWGDTTNHGVNDGSVNEGQADLDQVLANSGVRFAVTTGDVAYPGGTPTNYGDVNQTGVNISAVFGPQYWAVPGQRIPYFSINGNHGRNQTLLTTWPESAVAAASGGKYQMEDYSSFLGSTPASYPSTWYAFSTGNVRMYMLDASWSDTNTGSATGGACGSRCALYEVDHAAHWTTSSPEYQWLAQDLAAHPGGIKIAAFHFPLRSDDSTEPDDPYLKYTPGSSGTLEQLLHDNGVNLVLNGHAHIYQRNIAPPGGVISYVTGGGGAKPSGLGGAGCSSTDAYAISWSYSSNRGRACGAASPPSSDLQVFHFLKITVNGSVVTVAPTNSQGQVFDQQTYDFGADGTAPSQPLAVTATRMPGQNIWVHWISSSDNKRVAAYDVYRNGTYLTSVPAGTNSYSDAGTLCRRGTTYRVVARDLAGNTAGSTTQAMC
ncbi:MULTISPECIES: fibronectin type III domain-containing protein [unclassified Streptomyces]|uniref:fibronectin type III domain-containing protein n=1 Tax=unclassified Streptomyces TaxID=2593676 RepID=UPI0036F844E8